MNVDLIPVVRMENKDHFGHVFQLPTRIQSDFYVQSGALTFDRMHDIVGLSFSQILMDHCIINHTDTVHQDVYLERVFYEVNGDIRVIPVSEIADTKFINTNGRIGTLSVEIKFCDPVEENTTHLVKFSGSIDFETASTQISCTPVEGVKFLGYSLKARRVSHRPS